MDIQKLEVDIEKLEMDIQKLEVVIEKEEQGNRTTSLNQRHYLGTTESRRKRTQATITDWRHPHHAGHNNLP
jgi:hypothetical protein